MSRQNLTRIEKEICNKVNVLLIKHGLSYDIEEIRGTSIKLILHGAINAYIIIIDLSNYYMLSYQRDSQDPCDYAPTSLSRHEIKLINDLFNWWYDE